MVDLNSFLSADSTLVLVEATVINDTNQIVVQGIDSNTGGARVFLLTRNFSQPTFNFNGFFAPVDNPPAKNVQKAGQAVPAQHVANFQFKK